MKFSNRLIHKCLVSALPVALTFSLAHAAQTRTALFTQAQSVTDAAPGQVIQAKVWLKFHNKATLDQAVSNMYKKDSPTYHHWLKSSDLARFTPTASDIETVKKQLASQGLTVTSVGPRNAFLRVTGTVGAMQTAFQTQIKSLSMTGKTMRATTAEPKLAGTAGSMVAAVTGLTESTATPYVMRAVDPSTGKPFEVSPNVSTNGIFFASECFLNPQVENFTTPGAALPTAVYSGNRYGANPSNTARGTLAPCGYSAANFTTAYGMKNAYKKGLDGTGQTIVIVDAYEQPTILSDANLFSQLNGLPALTSSNFQILYPEGAPTAQNASSTDETSLDVEWAHAMAPGAKIDLILVPNLSFSYLEGAVYYAIENQLGSVISNSYGAPEAFVDPEDVSIENELSELGASVGISVNYSSGDYGDFAARYGTKTVSMPSDSPYATSVGGTSLAINSQNNMKFQTGWGNNYTQISSPNPDGSSHPLYPPFNDGFYAGAGGGESAAFLKPSWQSQLPGAGRQQPDVSLDADPFTGVEIILTPIGTTSPVVTVIGGTSLACPTFSAVWAIANQAAALKHGPNTLLGQAAPIVASLSGSDALTDVTDTSSPTNVAGIVVTSQGPQIYTPNQLVAPLQNTTNYVSALYDDSGYWFTLSFGTDSSLVTGPGWDNVTGFGTPNGLGFINAAAASAN